MTSSFPILDLVAGMIFIYFLLSIICSSAVEIVLTATGARATVLTKWLMTIFDKKLGSGVSLGQAIMDHCSVTALSGKGQAPSYIDAKNFTSALLEQVAAVGASSPAVIQKLDDLITIIQGSTVLSTEFQRVLLNYAYEAKSTYASVTVKTVSEIDLFRNKIENWYDSSMDRLGGYLKTKYSRPFTMIVAGITALALNADSVAIARYLYSNPDARAKVAAQAYTSARSDSLRLQVARIEAIKAIGKKDSLTVQQLQDTIAARSSELKNAYATLGGDVPIGWNCKVFNNADGKFSFWLLLSKICGLAGTFLAIMMGAPFWFDLLNKVSNLRGNGKKPGESPDLSQSVNPR